MILLKNAIKLRKGKKYLNVPSSQAFLVAPEADIYYI